MWCDELPAGKSWAALWFGYTRCRCGGIRFQSNCPACKEPLPQLPPRDIGGGRIVQMHVQAGGEGRGEDWVYLQLMEREWKRPVMPAELMPLGSGPPPSARAGIVILFWTYFETRIERLLRGIWRDAPAPLLEDALTRYLSIGSRLDRFYRLSCQTTYAADLRELGYEDIAELLAKVQARRNEFAHGSPQAIDDALVELVVTNLKREHESWIAVFNKRAARPTPPP